MTDILRQSNLAGQNYVRALTSAYRRGIRLQDPDYAHIQDPEAYNKLRRDAVVAHAMEFRRHKVAGQTWYIKPVADDEGNKLAAQVMKGCLTEIKRFSSARFNLSEAVFLGRTIGKIEGRRVTRGFGDGKPRPWWVPTRIRDVDRWRTRQVPVTHAGEGGPVITRWEWWSLGRAEWIPMTPKMRRSLVVHLYDDSEQSLGHGRGLLEALYHYGWAKTIVLREGLQGVERWAQGWVIAEVEGLRKADTGRINADHVEEWLSVIDSMRSRNALVHDKDEKLSVVQAGGEGHQIVISMLGYLDKSMTQLILAGLLPTGGGSEVGSLARSETEAESTEDLLQFDRDLLAETLTHDLVGQTWRLNAANLAALGLQGAMIPEFVSQRARHFDPEKEVGVIGQALGSKIPLRQDEVYERIGFTPPIEDDVVFEGAPEPVTAAAPIIPYGDGLLCEAGSVDTYTKEKPGRPDAPQPSAHTPRTGVFRPKGKGALTPRPNAPELTPSQVRAVQNYVRGKEASSTEIAGAVKAAGRFETPLTVYRGMRVEDEERIEFLKEVAFAIEEGHVLRFKGFQSASVEPKEVASLLGEGDLMLEIIAGEGLPLKGDLEPPSGEKEVLLGPDWDLRPVEITEGSPTVVRLKARVDE